MIDRKLTCVKTKIAEYVHTTIYHLPSTIYHLPSTIYYLLSTIYYLLSTIYDMSNVECHVCRQQLSSSKAFSVHEKSFCSLEHLIEYKASLPPPPPEPAIKSRLVHYGWGGKAF